jgi:RHS repeat-associated protein
LPSFTEEGTSVAVQSLRGSRPLVVALAITMALEGLWVVPQPAAARVAPPEPPADAPLASHAAIPDTTLRVSESTAGGQGNGTSGTVDVSADGRFVAFEAAASTLVDNDTNAVIDIFVRDLLSGETTRVSVSGGGAQANGASGDAAISADGRYVAFSSLATNLVTGDTNGDRDVFVHDRAMGATERVSVSSAETQADDASVDPAISADGRWLAFASDATNLVSGDANDDDDIFLRDRSAGTTTRASVSSAGAEANEASELPAISDDGGILIYQSDASNLVSGDTNAEKDIFVRDLAAGATSRVSKAAGGSQANDLSEDASISGDGTVAAFESDATNLVSGDTNAKKDVFVVTLASGAVERASVDSTEDQANHSSREAALSSDGRYVAFQSAASDLVAGDANGDRDVFVRDRTDGTTKLISVAAGGTGPGSDHSINPSLSADGRTVAFESDASDLVSGDTNAVRDGFVRRPVDAADASNLGRQPQHSLEGWDLGAGDALDVNVATGNLAVSHPVVSLPIRGSSLAVALTYNSRDTANVGLGRGWRLDLQRRLTVNDDGTVTFVDADGARHTFFAPQTSGTVTTYTRPDRLYATLVKDTSLGTEFTLTYRDLRQDKFDLAGSEALLVRAEDRFDNGVDIAYSSGTANISTVTDPNSRQLAFTWDTAPAIDRLSSFSDWAYISSGVVQTAATGSLRSYRFFYDAGGQLAGWSDPLNTAGTCPTGGSHLTCLSYSAGLLTAIGKTQTVTTFSSGTLGTTTRAISTAIAHAVGRVSTVTDAEQVYQVGPATTFTLDTPTQVTVARPTTTTRYELLAAHDAFARVASSFRVYDGTTEIERATTWDTTYPIEPASITDNADAVLDAPARAVSFTYVASSLGLLAKLVEPLTATTNRWTEPSYNANNDVTQTIVSQDGSGSLRTITRFCYDTGCNLTGAGLSLLKQIDNYVSGGATDDDTNVATEFVSDTYGQRTRVIRHNRDAAGATLDDREDRFNFDANGNLTSEIVNYANGTVTSPGDDITPNATTLARTDLTTTPAYDTAGNRVSSADPRRAILAATGSPAVDDYVTRWEYDALNQQVSEETPTTPGLASTQRTATSTYDELGGPRTATDFGALVTATEFDSVGRALRTFEDPTSGSASVTSIMTHDPDGKTVTAKDRRQAADSGLGLTTYAYDAIGRQTSVITADGTSSEAQDDNAFDGLDRRTSLEIGVGAASSLLTVYAYDLGGRVVETDDAFACATGSFDYRGLPIVTTFGLAGGTCVDAAETRELTHTHDGLGRLARSEVTDGADLGDRTVDDVFDAVGNRRSAAARVDSVTSTTTFGVDLLDQVTSEARADSSTAKATFDPADNPTDRCYWKPGITVGACYPVSTTPWTDPPTQVTTTAYDARNERVSLTDTAAGSTTTYDPDHNYALKAMYRTTGSSREHQSLYAYDARHRLTGITFQTCTANSSHACTDTPVSNGSDTYAYDDNDNRTQVVEHNGSGSTDRRYCYDALNQLIYRNTGAACASGSNDEAWTFDDAANRLSAISSGTTTNFAYDASGLLCDVEVGSAANCSGGNVSHDTAGRIESWTGWTLAYDADARLVSACKSATCASGYDKVEFTYDGEGHRTKIVATAAAGGVTTTEFRYQGDAVVEEKVSGTVVRQFVTDESGAISKLIIPAGQTDAGTYLVTWNGHGDALNLLRVNGDGTTTLANSFTYDSWGKPTLATHNGIGDLGFRYLYVGQFDVQWDDQFGLELHYMHARHYAPTLGQFLQPDPVRAEANSHAYGAANPVSGSDPYGTEYYPGYALNSSEWNYCKWPWNWPTCSLVYGSYAIGAWIQTGNTFGNQRDGTRGNAFKHCYWSALITYWHGASTARLYTDMHETSQKAGPLKTMDLVNNSIGRSVGVSYSFSRLDDGCLYLLKQGKLRVVYP